MLKTAKTLNPTAAYFSKLYNGNPVQAFVAPPEIQGRYYYNANLDGFNFQQKTVGLSQILSQLIEQKDHPQPMSIYVGSTPTNTIMPDFMAENPLSLVDDTVIPRLWIGNQTRISLTMMFRKISPAVVSGRRKFTLFPTDQLKNLYVGPLEHTPAGQSLSLVDFKYPDHEKYPRFKEALTHSLAAELEPGDAIYIPSLWWHHVEGLDSVNTLINYWWKPSPDYMGSPFDALLHCILTIKDLPMHQKRAWQSVFNHYIFQTDEDPVEHLPDHAKGVLGPVTPDQARRLRACLINFLNS